MSKGAVVHFFAKMWGNKPQTTMFVPPQWPSYIFFTLEGAAEARRTHLYTRLTAKGVIFLRSIFRGVKSNPFKSKPP